MALFLSSGPHKAFYTIILPLPTHTCSSDSDLVPTAARVRARVNHGVTYDTIQDMWSMIVIILQYSNSVRNDIL